MWAGRIVEKFHGSLQIRARRVSIFVVVLFCFYTLTLQVKLIFHAFLKKELLIVLLVNLFKRIVSCEP